MAALVTTPGAILFKVKAQGCERERHVRRLLQLQPETLRSITLLQFLHWLGTNVGLRRRLAIAYCDDEGDKIPVKTEDEFNVLKYMAEQSAREGRALEVRVLEQADSALGSAARTKPPATVSVSTQAPPCAAPQAPYGLSTSGGRWTGGAVTSHGLTMPASSRPVGGGSTSQTYPLPQPTYTAAAQTYLVPQPTYTQARQPYTLVAPNCRESASCRPGRAVVPADSGPFSPSSDLQRRTQQRREVPADSGPSSTSSDLQRRTQQRREVTGESSPASTPSDLQRRSRRGMEPPPPFCESDDSSAASDLQRRSRRGAEPPPPFGESDARTRTETGGERKKRHRTLERAVREGSDRKGKERDMPAWFSAFMTQFRKELVEDVTAAVKEQIGSLPPPVTLQVSQSDLEDLLESRREASPEVAAAVADSAAVEAVAEAMARCHLSADSGQGCTVPGVHTGKTVYSATGGSVVSAAGGSVVSPGGGSVVSSGGGSVVSSGGESVVSSAGSCVVGSAGGSVVSSGGGSVVSPGGGSVFSPGGGSVVSAAGGSVVSSGGESVVSSAGSCVVGSAGGSVISPGGGSVVSPGGGSVVSSGGGSVVSSGGGSVVSPGGESVISPGGGCVVSSGGGSVISPGGGSIVSPGGGSVVSPGGGSVVSPGGGSVVSPGGGSVVSPGGGSVVSSGGGSVVGSAGGSVVTLSGWSVVSSGGGSVVSSGGGSVFSSGGGSVVSSAGGSVVSSGGGCAISSDGGCVSPVRSLASAGRSLRPRRCLSEADDNGLLVMVERTASELEAPGALDLSVRAVGGQPEEEEVVTQPPAPLRTAPAADKQEQEAETAPAGPQPQSQPQSELQSQPQPQPQPQPEPQSQPEPEPEPQSQAEPQPQVPSQPLRQPQPEPEPDPDLEDFVTVNGHRLSLSEDDFSDIVVIASPAGSERFEMVEEEEEEDEEEDPMTRTMTESVRSVREKQLTPDAAGEAMIASALSEKWCDASGSLVASADSGWLQAPSDVEQSGMFCSDPLRSTCESAPAACPVVVSEPAAAAPPTTVSLPADVGLPSQPEQPQQQQQQQQQPQPQPQPQQQQQQQQQQPPPPPPPPSQQQQPDEAGQQQDEEEECDCGECRAAWEEVGQRRWSLVDSIACLPEQVQAGVRDCLLSLPEQRQLQFASSLSGRRGGVETYWSQLAALAARHGRSPLEQLLDDHAHRPGSVGLLYDALHALLRHVKVTAGSSSQADGAGAQAVKQALCLLRACLDGAETGGGAWSEEPSDTEPDQQQQPAETGVKTLLVVAEEEQGEQEEAAASRRRAWRPSSRLAALLPEWVQSFLSYQQERGAPDTVPTEQEAMVISRLVDMGFSDLDRIRALYQEHGDDCNTIASLLLDSRH